MLGIIKTAIQLLSTLFKGSGGRILGFIKDKAFEYLKDPQALLSVLGIATGFIKWLLGMIVSPWGKIVSIVILVASGGILIAFLMGGDNVEEEKDKQIRSQQEVIEGLRHQLYEGTLSKYNEFVDNAEESKVTDDSLNSSRKELKKDKEEINSVYKDKANNAGSDNDHTKRLQQLKESGNRKLQEYKRGASK